MNHVRIEDFLQQPDLYLNVRHMVAIDKDDQTVGYFVPAPSAHNEDSPHALADLDETIQRILARTGITEDQLADLLDPSKPLPSDIIAEASAPSAAGR
jgi:hypothetical protein